jgi:cell division protein FtsQ
MKMSTDYYYIASDDIASKKKSAGKIVKGLKRLLLIAAVIFAAQLIWLFGITPFTSFSSVDIHGFSALHRNEILSLAGIDETSSYISTNARTVQERLSSHILVESAVVMKRFPDRLSIFLVPREAAAVTLINVNSRQVPMYVDRHGVFFKIGEPGLKVNPDLPIISGIENPHLSMRLPAALVSLVESLNRMAVTSPELLSVISEIKVERKTWDGYDLILYPVHSTIRVRVENNITEATLRYMLLMLNVFENDLNKPQEIDFRSGIGSYQIQEGLL